MEKEPLSDFAVAAYLTTLSMLILLGVVAYLL